MASQEDVRGARQAEFLRRLSFAAEPISRRRFIELMGASMALAGGVSCAGPPRETIVPYVRQPEQAVPGRPLYFATALPLFGYAMGALVESHLGRPTKIEGNPDHPASLGATDAYMQASALQLYDPARSKSILNGGRIRTWTDFVSALNGRVSGLSSQGGAGLRLLTETVTSPTLADQIRGILGSLPAARWHQFTPVGRENARAGAQLAFGQPAEARYRFDAADIVLLLDGDPLMEAPGRLRYARDFATRRRARAGGASLSRIYAIESTPSLIGSIADERVALAPSQIPRAAAVIAQGLGVTVGAPTSSMEGLPTAWLDALAVDLQAHRGASLVIAGESQPPQVHALAHAMNEALGNVGRTVEYSGPIAAEPTGAAGSLAQLVQDMAAGQVDTLIMLGGNPAYTAPSDLGFAEVLARVPLSVHLSLYEDETSALSTWHIPDLHPLETWSDARAYDGTASIGQPLIAPLYGGKSAHEVLAALTDQPGRSAHDLVKGYWQSQYAGADFDAFWTKALHDGFVPGTAAPPISVQVQANALGQPAAPPPQPGALEIVFRPDPAVFDGRYASNAWLQELPKPFTTLTWDNVALMSSATAQRLGVQTGDVVELTLQGRSIHAPAWILAGQADDTVTVTLGYGRTRGAGVGNGVGYNAYAIRRSDAPWADVGIEVRKTGATHALAATQASLQMQRRPIVPATTLAAFLSDPRFIPESVQPAEANGSLYPAYPYPGHRWGMAIDLNTCIGCNACVVACQAENNIPVVGKAEVLRGRAMHWLRIDTYFPDAAAQPLTYHQPVPCMHCETAPCELVCPVGATVHSDEGLNDMVYNRCVGTRYCSNNCPYKVRHFNFFQYSDYDTESLKLQRNPNVTVRSRGVMEKCTYCVQRIRRAEIDARRENRPIRDGEILTACQAACPTGAIVFGDINDSSAQVTHLKSEPHNYALLGELNTRPRTTYLGVVTNPNPSMQGS